MLNSHSNCSTIKDRFLLDDNFKPKKNAIYQSNKTLSELLLGFCHSNEDNEIILDCRYFKLIYNLNCIDCDSIIQHVINVIRTTLEKRETFIIHVCLKSLSLTDIDKYYKFICKISEVLKITFPDKLDKCFIYKAPFIFSQLFSIISAFVDKKTMTKLELVA
jgi:hypothetical protein